MNIQNSIIIYREIMSKLEQKIKEIPMRKDKKSEKIRRNKPKIFEIYTILIMLSTLFMSVGFAQITDVKLDATGTLIAPIQTGVFISDILVAKTSGVNNEEVKYYTGTTLSTSVELSTDKNACITYQIELYNNSTSDYYFKGVAYDEYAYSNKNIEYSIEGAEEYITVIKAKQTTELGLKFKHKAGTTVSAAQTLNSLLNIEFSNEFLEIPILETIYTLPKGATWEQYIESEYNTAGFQIGDGKIYTSAGKQLLYTDKTSNIIGEDVNAIDVISDTVQYIPEPTITLDKEELLLKGKEGITKTENITVTTDNPSLELTWKVETENSGITISGTGNTRTITVSKQVENASITISYGSHVIKTCKVTVVASRAGETVKYDSNNDGVREDWIILTDEYGLVEIVSAQPMGNLTLGPGDTSVSVTTDIDGDGTVGDDGDKAIASYNNSIATINNYCKSLVTAVDNGGVRSVGGTDNSYTAYHSTTYDDWGKNITVDVATTDSKYKTDFDKMQELGIHSCEEEYWMASRHVYSSSNFVYFRDRFVNTSGVIDYYWLWNVRSNGVVTGSDNSCAVRPVIINPLSLISLTVKEGTTWEQYIGSEYNTAGYKIIDGKVYTSENKQLLYTDKTNGEYVYVSDVISDNVQYYISRELVEGLKVKYDSNKDGVKEDWIVLTAEPGLVEIVSAEPMGSLALGKNDTSVSVTTDLNGDGTVGDVDDVRIASYNNAITTINNYCKSLVTATDNGGVRSLGASDDTSDYDENSFKLGDEYYTTDFEKMAELGITTCNKAYWFASRMLEKTTGLLPITNLCVRSVNASGSLVTTKVYTKGGIINTPSDAKYAVRPVIKNPSGIVFHERLTWVEYIASSANKKGYYTSGGKVYTSEGKQLLYTDKTNNIIGEYVYGADEILDTAEYIPAPTITLDKKEISQDLTRGATFTETLTATIDNTDLELTWKVTGSGITISGSGNTRTITTAKLGGNATITVSYGKISKTCTVAVKTIAKYDSNNDGTKEDWIVITDEEGLVEIVSAEPMGSLALGKNDTSVSVTTDLDGDGTVGNEGDIAIASYNNAITTINNYCKSLVTATDNGGVRSVGGTNNSYTAYHSTNYDNWGKNITVDVATGDEYYKTDYDKMKELGILNTGSAYWLASRRVSENSSYVYFYVRYVSTGGDLYYSTLWYVKSDGSGSSSNPSYAVRPVIINPSGI